jgi:hypothetical protein
VQSPLVVGPSAHGLRRIVPITGRQLRGAQHSWTRGARGSGLAVRAARRGARRRSALHAPDVGQRADHGDEPRPSSRLSGGDGATRPR